MPPREEESVESQEVRVFEACPQDVGRGIARLDPEIAEKLFIVSGDVIEIKGRGRKTAALTKYGFPDDRRKGIIRIDGATRRNARVSIGEKVMIQKIEAEMATSITFAPTEPLRISGGEVFLSRMLESRVITTGDFIEVPVMNRKLVLKVIRHTPSAVAVIVTNLTEIVISDNMVELLHLEDERITLIEFVRKLRTELGSFLERFPIETSKTLYKGKTLHERLQDAAYQFELTPEGVRGKKILDADEALKFSVFEEMMRIFPRLTRMTSRSPLPVYPTTTRMTSQSLVPLKDLLDDEEDDEKVAFYRLLLAEMAKRVPFPFKYYPLSGNFEIRKDALSWAITLENAKAVMMGACPHCSEQLTEQQVKEFEEGESPVCNNCEQVIAQKGYIESEGMMRYRS
ncbi:MAG: hypothetical protein ACXAEU_24530 [Candidatus Hodarchaeales archaeon]|jgi:hypothetical protein